MEERHGGDFRWGASLGSSFGAAILSAAHESGSAAMTSTM